MKDCLGNQDLVREEGGRKGGREGEREGGREEGGGDTKLSSNFREPPQQPWWSQYKCEQREEEDSRVHPPGQVQIPSRSLRESPEVPGGQAGGEVGESQ